jgi:hypothetical protein
MKDMTQKQAREEAIKRWGPNGTILLRPSKAGRTQRGRLARYRCVVSSGHGRVEGQADTWRAAFEDARQR